MRIRSGGRRTEVGSADDIKNVIGKGMHTALCAVMVWPKHRFVLVTQDFSPVTSSIGQGPVTSFASDSFIERVIIGHLTVEESIISEAQPDDHLNTMMNYGYCLFLSTRHIDDIFTVIGDDKSDKGDFLIAGVRRQEFKPPAALDWLRVKTQ